MTGLDLGALLAGVGLLLWGYSHFRNGVAYRRNVAEEKAHRERMESMQRDAVTAYVERSKAEGDAIRKAAEPPKEPWQ